MRLDVIQLTEYRPPIRSLKYADKNSFKSPLDIGIKRLSPVDIGIKTISPLEIGIRTQSKSSQCNCFLAVAVRSKADLLYYAEFIPTISTQLKIISSVKAATPSDTSVSANHSL